MTNEEYKKELTRYWDNIRDKDSCMMGEYSCIDVKCCNCMFSKICTAQRLNKYSGAFEAVELVKQWSKEHPIKTNGQVAKELLEEKFGIKINIFLGCNHIETSCGVFCDDCKYKDFWEQEYKER